MTKQKLSCHLNCAFFYSCNIFVASLWTCEASRVHMYICRVLATLSINQSVHWAWMPSTPCQENPWNEALLLLVVLRLKKITFEKLTTTGKQPRHTNKHKKVTAKCQDRSSKGRRGRKLEGSSLNTFSWTVRFEHQGSLKAHWSLYTLPVPTEVCAGTRIVHWISRHGLLLYMKCSCIFWCTHFPGCV